MRASKRVCVCVHVCEHVLRMSVHFCLGAQKNICTGAYHHDVTLQMVGNYSIWFSVDSLFLLEFPS